MFHFFTATSCHLKKKKKYLMICLFSVDVYQWGWGVSSQIKPGTGNQVNLQRWSKKHTSFFFFFLFSKQSIGFGKQFFQNPFRNLLIFINAVFILKYGWTVQFTQRSVLPAGRRRISQLGFLRGTCFLILSIGSV